MFVDICGELRLRMEEIQEYNNPLWEKIKLNPNDTELQRQLTHNMAQLTMIEEILMFIQTGMWPEEYLIECEKDLDI
jgi:hypothetical protein